MEAGGSTTWAVRVRAPSTIATRMPGSDSRTTHTVATDPAGALGPTLPSFRSIRRIRYGPGRTARRSLTVSRAEAGS